MTSSPRCTERGCAVRYRSGPDRACPLHADDGDTMLARMASFTELSAAPGERGEGETTADTEGDGPEGWPPDAG